MRRRLATIDATYYSAERLGENSHLTPEGFLLCTDVPIARIGSQLYREGEIPVDANSGGEIVIDRTPDEVFRPETLASFEGKPVVDDHPFDEDSAATGWDVNPDNVHRFQVGTTLHPRQGEGEWKDYVVADLLITRRDAIDAVRAGKRQISCGYDAQYETLGPGHGRQRNIIGNHVALVDLARCGPSCSIRDGDSRMATANRSDRWTRFMDSLRGAFVRKDQTEFESVLAAARDELVSTGEGSNVHVHLPQTGDPPERLTGDKKTTDAIAKLTKDVATLTAGFKQVVSYLARDKGEEEEEEDAERVRDGDDEDEDTRDRGRRGRDARRRGRDDDEEEEDEDTHDSVAEIFPGLAKLQDPETEATGNRSRGFRSAEVTPVARDRRGRDSAPGFRTRTGRARARDSQHLAPNYKDLVSRAEILVPGVRVPTFDATADATKTIDVMCGFRRRVLAAAWLQGGAARDAIAAVSSWTDADISGRLQQMTCDGALTLFNSASVMVGQRNNRLGGTFGLSVGGPGAGRDKQGPQSIADLNEANRKHYAGNKTAH